MNNKYDVAIIGAGIAGNAIAKSLADYGWETILFERKPFPRHKVCGEFLSPESQSMLKALGVSDLMDSLHPSRIDRTRLIFKHGGALDIPLPGTALGVSRYLLDEALLREAEGSGVHVKSAVTVTAVTANDGGGWIIEAKQGKETKVYESRAVIAAWGANGHASLIRTAAPAVSEVPTDFAAIRGQRSNRAAVKNPYVGVKSHFEGIQMEPVVELYFFEGGYLGMSPVEGGIINVAALMKQKAFPNKPKTVLGWIEAACSRNSSLYHRMSKAVPVPGSQSAVAPVDLSRKRLAWSLFPQVGDAALMIPPLCGDGMSMALRSAQLCAPLADRYLKGEITLSEWEYKYSQLIHQQFNGPRQWGRALQWLISAPILPRFLLPAARLTPKLAYRLVQATRLKESD